MSNRKGSIPNIHFFTEQSGSVPWEVNVLNKRLFLTHESAGDTKSHYLLFRFRVDDEKVIRNNYSDFQNQAKKGFVFGDYFEEDCYRYIVGDATFSGQRGERVPFLDNIDVKSQYRLNNVATLITKIMVNHWLPELSDLRLWSQRKENIKLWEKFGFSIIDKEWTYDSEGGPVMQLINVDMFTERINSVDMDEVGEAVASIPLPPPL